MKVIELLEKIAKKENLPKKIEVFDAIFHYIEKENMYRDEDGWSLDDYAIIDYLNDEVKILEITLEVENMNLTGGNNEYSNR
ncbi:MAG: hypothetical protein J6S67_05925 [Methanobrevibacter sp.]|nr:hypothetical protein [Methanobrevibacter sp.]